MVEHKSALKTLWTDVCSVYVYTPTINANNKRTEFIENAIYTDISCKLSFKHAYATDQTTHVAALHQTVTLFLDSAIAIPAGSKVVVEHNNSTFIYKASGEPNVFQYHQEISLQLWKGWA